ncbi:MAG: ParB N-terminal domain-containing protein [Rhodospirillales bacterium]|nr:ParB N-terminal domain-containing protein [Rhodospirillales bacterium]
MNVTPDTLLVLPLDAVVIPDDRLREVDPDRAEAMAISMRERGQITPIEVEKEGEIYKVVAGAHRVVAMRAAGFDKIAATVFEGSPDERRLREIDENLYRKELTPYDEAAFLAERLDIFRKLHGTLSKGRPKKSGASSHRFLFYAEVEGRFGLSVDKVKKSLARFEAFTPGQRAILRDFAATLSGAEIDALKRLPLHERDIAIGRLIHTPAREVLGEFRAAAAGAADAKTPLDRLKSAFIHLSAADQRAFLAWAKKATG